MRRGRFEEKVASSEMVNHLRKKRVRETWALDVFLL